MTEQRQPEQQQLPYTKVPNLFLEEWVNFLGLVEIRIVAAIIRRTFGYHRKESGPLSVSELSQITRRSRPLVIKALSRLKGYGIVSGSRISRQEALAYGLIMRPEFQALKEVPPPEKQKALPYDVYVFSSKENLTTEPVENVLSVVKKTLPPVVKEPLPLSGYENLTTDASALICIKESRSKESFKETHTPRAHESGSVENVIQMPEAASQRVFLSRFSKHQLREFAYASVAFTEAVNAYWEARGRKNFCVMGIRNPQGWATAARRSGEHDEEVQEWINDPGMFDIDRFRKENNGSNW